MPASLKEHFCLRERANFAINVKTSTEDAAHYFGSTSLDTSLSDRIEMGFRTGFPAKIYLWGEYGAGKTHTLYYLKYAFGTTWHQEDEGFGILPMVFEIECQSDTSFRSLHAELLNALGLARLKDAVKEFMSAHTASLEADEHELWGNADLIHVMKALAVGTNDAAFLAWRWLSGESLSPRERSDLGVSGNLRGAYDLVDIIIRVGKLFELLGTRLLYLIDEAESLHNVTKPDAQRSWHDGLRKLADQDNSTIAFVIAFFQTPTSRMAEFAVEQDIMTRIGPDSMIEVPPMEGVENVRQFVEELCVYMIESDCASQKGGSPFPFDGEALDLFAQICVEDLGAAVPRNIIRAVSECALESYRAGEKLITEAIVQSVVPRIVVRPDA